MSSRQLHRQIRGLGVRSDWRYDVGVYRLLLNNENEEDCLMRQSRVRSDKHQCVRNKVSVKETLS